MSIKTKLSWLSAGILLSMLKYVLRNRIIPAANLISPDLLRKAQTVNRIDYILQYCSGKKVIHAGFTDHPYTRAKIQASTLLHLHLKEVTKELLGVDNDASSVEEYSNLTGDNDVLEGDILRLETLPANTNFEIVLLGEILEHLKDPHQAIASLDRLFPRNTCFLVTTPNYTSIQNIAASLHKKELIHPDHYWYFSPVTLLKLFPSEKFELIDLNFGMHFQKNKKINFVLRKFPFMGECIIAVLKKIK